MSKKIKNKEHAKRSKDFSVRDSKFFLGFKPKRGYAFNGDYFITDGKKFGTVLTTLSDEGTDNKLPQFWGLKLFAGRVAPKDVVVRQFTKIKRKSNAWVDSHADLAEKVASSNGEESTNFGGRDKARTGRNMRSIDVVNEELASGASYLDTSMKYLVRANSLQELDDATHAINKFLSKGFESVRAEPLSGQMNTELSGLYRPIDTNDGHRFMFTSEEFAGYYNLMTHGVEDEDGEAIGIMTGDVNTSAVIFNFERYYSHVIIAAHNKASTLTYRNADLGYQKGCDMWGVKMAQSALKNNHRVVQIVLNDANVDAIGLDLSPISTTIDMTNGDINMFEPFGAKENEAAALNVMINKITLMAMLVGGVVEGSEEHGAMKTIMSDLLTDFYEERSLWSSAESDIGLRRFVGLSHSSYPILKRFSAYVNALYDRLNRSLSNDDVALQAASRLNGIFRNMLDVNGDLFNNRTSDKVDGVGQMPRVVYNFSSLRFRGVELAMAQLVNVFSFATASLMEGDVIIIHGAEYIQPSTKDFISKQLSELYTKRIRVVFVYGDVKAMLEEAKFNGLETADYTIIGSMTANDVKTYEQVIGRSVPKTLTSLVDDNRDYTYYLRRGLQNVMFGCDPRFGIGIGGSSDQ